jgi:hypothetical protein
MISDQWPVVEDNTSDCVLMVNKLDVYKYVLLETEKYYQIFVL